MTKMMPPILLICDLDEQLLEDLKSRERFGHWLTVHRKQVHLVYLTALSTDCVRELVEISRVPSPDFVIAWGGTEVDCFETGASAVGWKVKIPAAWNAGRIRDALAAFPELELHPESMQSPNKVSYFLDRALPRALLQIEIALASAGLEADLSYFKNQLLDVLPRGISKVSAAEHLLSLTRVPKHRTVVCGSSIGDLGLYQQGYRGIVTASADAELRERAPATACRCNRRFAAGLLEGIEYWISQEQSKSDSPIAWQFRSAEFPGREECAEDRLVPLASN
jgi:sucrose-6F-phosphate phosphohydrolase